MASRPRPQALLQAVALLAVLPLAGCAGPGGGGGGGALLSASGLFALDPIVRGEPGADPVPDCATLHATLRDRALAQARVSLDQSVQNDNGYHTLDFAVARSGAAELQAADSAEHSHAGPQVTGTNNQEAAADEADLVKTDGEWTYVLARGALHILRLHGLGGLEQVATLPVEGWGGELLLERRDPARADDDRLVLVVPGAAPAETDVLAQGAVRERLGWSGMTRVAVLSLADRANPIVEHETWVEGYPAGARLIDGVVYAVVQRWEQPLGLRTWAGPMEEDLDALGLTWEDYQALGEEGRRDVRRLVALRVDAENQRLLDRTDLGDALPLVLETKFGFLLPRPVSEETCRAVRSLPQSTGRSFSTILAVGVADPAIQTQATQVLGGSAVIYADAGSLVLASPSQDSWWTWAQPDLMEATDLLWFDLDGLGATLRASGRVPGSVLDSFALDVHDGALRVATTSGLWGGWWLRDAPAMSSSVTVLDAVGGALVPRGTVAGIAPGERIWSARFTDDRAYLVTFRQVDPLWVVELDPAPRILGELEIPGVSTYLHPLGDDALLAIGYGPGPGGVDLDWGRVQVSLFDLRDLSRPRRADVVDLVPAAGHAWSGATAEHRAFTYWDAIGTLAVPLTTSVGHEVRRGGASEWVQEVHAGLALVTVDREGWDLRLRGEVDQDLLASPGEWTSGVARSYFLGYPERGEVSLHSVGDLGVTAHDLATLRLQDAVAFADPAP